MIFLILSVIVSTLFGISFKVIAVKNINGFQAIIVNYVIAGSLGFLTTKSSVTPLNVVHESFFPIAVFLGIVFISSLFVISETTAKQGISVAQVANRMSVVVPISIAILFYGDGISVSKIIGIVLAIMAVYLVSHKETQGKVADKFWWLFPLIIFVCSGIIDSSINYAQRNLLNDLNFDAFLSTIFATAFIFGFIVLLYQLIIKKEKFQWQAIPAGMILGTINFGTMYFIISALNTNVLEPSVLFPINNLSILTISTVVSVIVFKEKLSSKNWIGIGLSLLAILILGLLPQLMK
ncbi:MAG: EamA family transporter [Bacteroidetes bacterium]|jgi:drug/metabolite transporter (DMT)-like permease|nr:EamA family transporter [Bacteroidota bacterium]